jgi:protein TonB
MHLRSRIQPILPTELTGRVEIPARPVAARQRRWLLWAAAISLLLHLVAVIGILFQPKTDLGETRATAPAEWQIEVQQDRQSAAPQPSAPQDSQLPSPAPRPPTPPADKPRPQQPLPPVETPPPAPDAVMPAPPKPPVTPPKAEARPTPVQPAPAPSPFTQLLRGSDFFLPRRPPPAEASPPAQERRALNLALGGAERYSAAPESRHQNDLDADVQVSGAEVGTDWMQQLHVWWVEHRRYPEQAIKMHESGTVVIRFDVDRNGWTSGAEILQHSGSQWLDMQTMATFGHAHLPPLPPTTPQDHATLTLTVRYEIY